MYLLILLHLLLMSVALVVTLSVHMSVEQAGDGINSKQTKTCEDNGGECVAKNACGGKVIPANCDKDEVCCVSGTDVATLTGTDVLTLTESDEVTPSPAELCLADNIKDIDESSQAPVKFAIKSWASGKYIHTKDQDNSCGAELVVAAALNDNAHFEFVIHEQSQWGYILHVQSGKYVIPKGGLYDPPSGTPLVLSANKRPWGLFELDQVNKFILHESGLHVHIDGYTPYPPDNTIIHLVESETPSYNSEWVFVNPANPDKVVPPYGNATINGDWRLFFSVDKPLAAQTYSVEFTLGYSETESVSSSFQFGWEVTGNVRTLFAEMSVKASLALEIQYTSSETWSSETKITNEFKVNVNESVAVWQKIFVGEQCRHRSVYQSDIYAHTNSPLKPPGEDYTPLNFQLT